MAKSEIFVGRKKELKGFVKVLEDQRGQAIIVTGNRGMGKTWLVNRMAKLASEHPALKCGWVRYEVTPNNSPDSTMAIMMDNAFDAGQVTEGSFDGTRRGLEQWRGFFNVFNLGDLVLSLRRDPAKDTRQQFLERLGLISERMPENGRAIFIVDPEKYMAKESDQDWAIVVKNLPEKIKFIFAQRTEDEILKGRAFKGLKNVVWIPRAELDVLATEEVDELVRIGAKEIGQEEMALRGAVERYKGHPYAIQAALGIIEKTKKIEELPQDPTEEGVAEGQWEQVNEISEDAIKLFEAYAVLETAVPDDVVECVSKLNITTRKRLQNDKYLRGLLREEAGGRRIYHSILADYILEQMSKDENTEYHKRAVEVYRDKLKKAKEEHTKPDEQAAVRLPEHVLVAEGEEAFVKTCAYETWTPLSILGLLDNAIELAKRALDIAREGSTEEAAILCTIGLAFKSRGDLDDAEKMHKKSLEIEKKLGRLEGMARQYGNLGLIYQTRGDLDKAEEMHKKSLEIEEKLGRLEGMARQYGNLGLIYQIRGDLNKAEEMHKRAFEIDERIGRLEGMASDYGSLGLIYRKRGDLDKAEQMHKRAFELNERIGRLEGMANDYGNLGLVYEQRRDYKSAREYWEKARDLFKKMGMPNELKMVEGWIERIKGK